LTSSQYRVIYGDTDQMGVVYYANYLAFFERGRCEWLREHHVDYKEMEAGGVVVPVIEANVRYRAPARFDDLITIDCDITSSTRATFTFTYRITRDATLLCEGSTVHACMTKDDGKPTRIPERLLRAAGLDAKRTSP
jgi:acyl-CoA thioester hydrolase